MNIFRLIGEIIVIYLLYKFIFGFIIPLWRASKEMKGKMSDIQERMRQQQQAEELRRQQDASRTQQTQRKLDEDYIEYEEVK